MLSNLLTALGVAALSIQTPSNIQPQEPKRAYYDSSAVAEYGTTVDKIFNYSSYDVASVSNNVIQTSISANSNGYFYYEDGGDYLLIFIASNADGDNSSSRTALYSNGERVAGSLDVYFNGSFVYTFEALATGNYEINIPSDLHTEGINDYIWFFDHYEPTMSETIAEVVGDATTAAGAVLGSGISGAIALFYNEGITGLGIIALILTGVSLVWFAFSLVLRLWRRR